MLLVPVLLGNLRSLEVFGAFGAAGFLDRQEATGSGISVGTVWPSGLRRWLKAPFRKGVGSNPTAVNYTKKYLLRGFDGSPCLDASCQNFSPRLFPSGPMSRRSHAAPLQHTSNRVDTLGIEPRAFRMRTGCDTTTPCALEWRCTLRVLLHSSTLAIEWTHWGLSAGPSACEADVIPLHHVPLNGGAP